MFADHLRVAFAAGRAEPDINVGVLAAAALLLDLLLWLLILLGWELVVIPADFAQTHQPEFVFPYSHGLLCSVLWSVLAGVLGFLFYKGRAEKSFRAALLVAGVVFSHWLLDALVHRPELSLTGTLSRRVGLGLWDNLPIALAFTIVGMTLAPPPPSANTMAMSSLSTIVLLCVLIGWIGRRVRARPT